jgi:arsenical pump membrane protein
MARTGGTSGAASSGAAVSGTSLLARLRWVAPAIGLPVLVLAVVLAPSDAGAAARQDWPPFVLVTGLLLLGLVARADGLFDAAGAFVAGLARNGLTLLLASAALVAVVTSVLNLDTSVAFLTPVLVAAARRRRAGEELLLYLSVFLANGASLLLPGSNLTNLIVIGDRHLSGGAFAAAMLPAWIAAVVTIPLVLAVVFRRELSRNGDPTPSPPSRPRLGAGTVGVAVAVVTMLVLSGGTLALVVAATGCAAAGWHLGHHRLTRREVERAVQVPVLAGLFGLAVALGTLGRVWSGPSTLLVHTSSWQAAVVGAVTSVVCNNLPAASLLAARPPPDPHALLVGLNLGPNLAVTGALSALIWLQVGRASGSRPSPARFTRLGLVVTPVSVAAALLALHLAG